MESSNPEGENEIKIEMPDEEKMRRLYEASKIGSIENLMTLIQDDPNILHQVLVSSSNTENPLHISVSFGHHEFTRFLLDQKPELTGEVDGRQRTPLHLASANGEIEIVRELLEKNISVCLFRDLNGMIPLHYAVIKGKIEIIKELIKARPQSVSTKLANDQTVLHLCVKGNHLEALKLLTEISLIHDKEFLNTTDDSGNTILDLSLMLRQVEIVRYLLSIPEIKTGTTSIMTDFATSSNPAGVQETVINIRETPQLIQSSTPAETKTRGWWKVWKQKTKYKGDWVEEVQGTMMLVATVIATVTFQGSINPPGGVWQQDTLYNETSLECSNYGSCFNNRTFLAGTAVTAYQQVYSFYSLANTISFVASVSVILLIISGFPLRNRIGGWILRIAMCVAVYFLMTAYLQGTSMVSSNNGWLANILVVFVMMGITGLFFLWYVISCLIWMWKRVFCKFTSCFSRLAYKRLYLSVYVFVCVLCVFVFVFFLLLLVSSYPFLHLLGRLINI